MSTESPLPELPALETTDLTKSYGERVAVDGMNLSVERGELVALVGSNGAGKSTLLQLAAGLLDPTSGSVTIEGAPAGSLAARAGVVHPRPAVALRRPQRERAHRICGAAPRASRAPRHRRRAPRAARARRPRRRPPARFSRGLRQKTSILLGLVRPFAVLLVDEPFVGLDPSGQRTLVELVEGAVAAGAAVLLATHQLTFLDRATRCIVLSDGHVAYSGPVDRGRDRRPAGVSSKLASGTFLQSRGRWDREPTTRSLMPALLEERPDVAPDGRTTGNNEITIRVVTERARSPASGSRAPAAQGAPGDGCRRSARSWPRSASACWRWSGS